MNEAPTMDRLSPFAKEQFARDQPARAGLWQIFLCRTDGLILAASPVA